jgi:hypothetical protein
LVSDIPAGDGKNVNLFYSVQQHSHSQHLFLPTTLSADTHTWQDNDNFVVLTRMASPLLVLFLFSESGFSLICT